MIRKPKKHLKSQDDLNGFHGYERGSEKVPLKKGILRATVQASLGRFGSGSSQLLFSLRLIEKEEGHSEPPKSEEKPTKEEGRDGRKGEDKKDSSPGNNGAMMSDAQKRYLFRIMAEQGLAGEAAHEELKKSFGVDSLKKVTKLEASREIERRLEALKGDGPSA